METWQKNYVSYNKKQLYSKSYHKISSLNAFKKVRKFIYLPQVICSVCNCDGKSTDKIGFPRGFLARLQNHVKLSYPGGHRLHRTWPTSATPSQTQHKHDADWPEQLGNYIFFSVLFSLKPSSHFWWRSVALSETHMQAQHTCKSVLQFLHY